MASLNEFQYAQTINGITERIAFQLGDAEPGDAYDAYDHDWIRARVYDTFKWLQGRRPNLFANEVTFELVAGSRQCVPEECEKLLEVTSITVDGKHHPVYESDYDAMLSARVYNSLIPECALDCDVFDYAVSEVDSEKFLISPPVSPAKPVSITASCSDMNRFFSDCDKELDCDISKWINTVIEYVLYQAHNMDVDNPVSESVAERHRSTFFDLAPVQRRNDQNR